MNRIIGKVLIVILGILVSALGGWWVIIEFGKPIGAITLFSGAGLCSISMMHLFTSDIADEDRALLQNKVFLQAGVFCFGYLAFSLAIIGYFINIGIYRIIFLTLVGISLLHSAIQGLRKLNKSKPEL